MLLVYMTGFPSTGVASLKHLQEKYISLQEYFVMFDLVVHGFVLIFLEPVLG